MRRSAPWPKRWPPPRFSDSAYLHGAAPRWEVYKPVGEDYPALRRRGPAGFQDLVRRTLVKFVDLDRRIALPPVKPGVGW